MNLDSLSITLSQIHYLVVTLSKKTHCNISKELSQLISCYGLEADRHLLRCLFSEVNFNSDNSKGSSSKDNIQQIQLLTHECEVLIGKPALVSVLCFAIDKALQQEDNFVKNKNQILTVISKILKLTPVHEVVFGLTLLHSSNQSVADSALEFVKQKLPAFIRSHVGEDSANLGVLHNASPQVIHFILTYLFNSENSRLCISKELKEQFIESLRRDFPKELAPVVLSPFLYPVIDHNLQTRIMTDDTSAIADSSFDDSLPTMIMEMGYKFFVSLDETKRNLESLHVHDLSPNVIAKVIIMMVHNHTGLDDHAFWTDSGPENNNNDTTHPPTTWNVEIFVQVIKEKIPSITWTEVIRELDCGELLLKDRQGLILLIAILQLGLQGSVDMFPIELFYRPWKHPESQFTLINQILKNPDIFCFADHSHHSISMEVLKSPPENDSKEMATWKSVELVELLIHLAECGLNSQVQELLKYPIQHCPDYLLLALLQTSQPLTLFKRDIYLTIIPFFLNSHINSIPVLNYIWQNQNLNAKNLLLDAMAEWYMQGDGDQSRLSRLLDITHELKGLASILNGSQYQFTIDLACLASRREYLKLEKWLSDRIRDGGEPFVTTLVKFAQKRCSQLFGMSKDDGHKAITMLSQDTIAIIISCLQSCLRSCSNEISEAIVSLTNNFEAFMKRQQQQQQIPRQNTYNRNQTFSTVGNQIDTINNIGNSIANMNLGATSTSNAFSLPAALGTLVPSTPGSPSRIVNLQQSAQFPLHLAAQHMTNSVNIINPQLNNGGPSHLPLNLISNNVAANRLISQPSANNIGTGDNASLDRERQGAGVPSIAKDIEEEANGYFQRIYNHPPHSTLTISEVLELLRKFRDSTIQREREIYKCMIKNLFEEYRFFDQYPENELNITAKLYGGIIANDIVVPHGNAYATGLKCICESLKKPLNNKIFSFGVIALEQIKYKLKENHTVANYLLNLPNLNDLPQHLIEFIKYGVKGLDPTAVKSQTSNNAVQIINSSGPAVTTSTRSMSLTSTTTSVSASVSSRTPAVRPSIANATNIDTLLVATEKDEKIVLPTEILQDKVAFIFNNLSQMNLTAKCDDVRDLIQEEHYTWLAQYLVVKRVSIEINFQPLYMNFIDCLKINEFYKLILSETYRNIRVLLKCDKTSTNLSDRTLLKNLGHWLGMLTLGKNKPILMDDLDMRSLLLEAHEKGSHEMLYIVPFVAKILEACSKSKIFSPPNPWTMSVIYILAAIHCEHDLKLNLKFEIEVLCKALSIKLEHLKPPEGITVLDKEILKHADPQLSTISKKPALPISTGGHQQSHRASPIITSTIVQQAMQSSVVPNIIPSGPIPLPPPPTPADDNLRLHSRVESPTLMAPPPEPKYNLATFNVGNIQSLGAHLTVNSQLAFFQAYPQYKQYVKTAFEKALQDWLGAIVDRSVKIATNTVEQIVKRDFALDPDDSRLRGAAHYMVRNLAAGMAMITCREQIMNSFTQNLKNTFMAAVANPNMQQKELIEQAVSVCVNDNMELACAFAQKTSIDKAIHEIDRHLIPEYDRRKIARNEGRRYFDQNVLTFHNERMPEILRLKVGPVTNLQMAVYETFARKIPGFKTMSDKEASMCNINKNVQPSMHLQFMNNSQDDFNNTYNSSNNKNEIDVYHQMLDSINTPVTNHQQLLEAMQIHKRRADVQSALIVATKAVEGLLECMSQNEDDNTQRCRNLCLEALRGLQETTTIGHAWTNKAVTKALIECREECRYNTEVLYLLVQHHLVNMQVYDQHLAVAMDNGNNLGVVAFCIQIMQHFLIRHRNTGLVTDQDFEHCTNMFKRIISNSRNPPDDLLCLMELIRENQETNMETTVPSAYIKSGILQAKTREMDEPHLIEKTDYLLREWVNVYQTSSNKDPSKSFSLFVHQMNLHGILKTDELITKFFRLSTQFVVDSCYGALKEPDNYNTDRMKVFLTLDAFVKLIALLVKHSGDANNVMTKLNLLNKVLGILVGVLQKDHEKRLDEFHQLPYHRMFTMLFTELNNTADPVLESISLPVTQAFTLALHHLRPSKYPGFVFSWIELMSHRLYLGRVLSHSQTKNWSGYAKLLVELFKFMGPYLRNTALKKSVATLYRGALKVMLVLLHDFPEFLCDYHCDFCDVIPANCIQMRNLILSAYPRNMRLPDPFTPNLKVDMLNEILHAPSIAHSYLLLIEPETLRHELQDFLKTPHSTSTPTPVFLQNFRERLLTPNETTGVRCYNVALINAIVLYVGSQAINHIRGKGLTPNMTNIAQTPHMDFYLYLSRDLDSEGRYLLLNAIANQLRYPNSHTHYFSCVLLYLFTEAESEYLQEQISRVLLERIIVNRPHPWGLLITFIELIKNPIYEFWSHDFVHCAEEIKKLLESVARSCMVPNQQIHGQNQVETE